MPIPEFHLPHLVGTQYQDSPDQWISRVLQYGLSAPYPDQPDMKWLMPGERLLPAGTYSTSFRGPYNKPCRFMIVAPAPEIEEYRNQRYLTSLAGKVLRSAFEKAGFETQDLYYTSLMRVPRPLNSSAFKLSWLKFGWEYFVEEFEVLKPVGVLFLGAETCKLAFGSRYSLESIRGQPQTFKTPGWTAHAMGCASHLSFSSNTAGLEALVKQLEIFRDIANPHRGQLDGLTYPDRDYRVLTGPEEIEAEVTAALKGNKVFAIDTETATDTARPEHTYCVSFQWSERPGHGRVIPLLVERPEPIGESGPTYQGSGVDRKSMKDRVPYYQVAKEQIHRLCANASRLIGHNLRYDLVRIRDEFGVEIRQFCNATRGWDTMLAYHLLQKDEYGLKQLVLRFTNMGAYDAPMLKWCVDNSGVGKLLGAGEDSMFAHGYRDIPYKYLLPYAMCDVDATFRIYQELSREMYSEGKERLAYLMDSIEMPLQAALIDIEDNGMPVDRERLESLSKTYSSKCQSLVEQLQALLWDGFNPNSPDQLQWWLFGGRFKKSDVLEDRLSAIPLKTPRLNAVPKFTTGKYPKKWETLSPDELQYNSPSTDTDAIKSLVGECQNRPEHLKVLEVLLAYREIKQFSTLFLCEPDYDPRVCPDYPIYGKGLLGCIRDDGRISTQISTLSETGRWRHSRPNLANLPKNKEKGVEKILGGKVPMIRSCFKARDDWIFIEADYKSAELFALGYMSGDLEFNRVLDTEPDVHGYNAVQVFHLDCAPKEVEERYPHLRAAIKTTIFGQLAELKPRN